MTGERFSVKSSKKKNLFLLSGVIEESFNTKDIKDKDQFWQTMSTALKHDAMLGCSISVCIQFQLFF